MRHARKFDVKPVTPEGRKCFFGYYDKTPWSPDGSRFLFHGVEFQDRPPSAEDMARICLLETDTGRVSEIGETRAWNFQQGAMLQWLDENRIIYNVREDGEFGCRIAEVSSGRHTSVSRPVSALSRCGQRAVSINFARLARHRRGYGYEGGVDRCEDEKWPSGDGIYFVDMVSGKTELIITLEQMLEFRKEDGIRERFGWFNHTLFSPDGKRFVFLNRWTHPPRHLTRMFVADIDGGNIRNLFDSYLISHFDWKNNSELIVWAEVGGRKGFWTVDADTGECSLTHEKLQEEDGHCSFSRDERAVLVDTYPLDDHRLLRLFDVVEGEDALIGKYYSAPEITGEIRCDLHPRWNRDETQISFDSIHEGYRRVYVVSPGR